VRTGSGGPVAITRKTQGQQSTVDEEGAEAPEEIENPKYGNAAHPPGQKFPQTQQEDPRLADDEDKLRREETGTVRGYVGKRPVFGEEVGHNQESETDGRVGVAEDSEERVMEILRRMRQPS
jgi:hypothetical protein